MRDMFSTCVEWWSAQEGKGNSSRHKGKGKGTSGWKGVWNQFRPSRPATEPDLSRDWRDPWQDHEFYATLSVSLLQQQLHELKGRRAQKERANEWLSRKELATLREVVDLPVTAARWRIAPRKRFQKPPHEFPRDRVSALLGPQPG